MIAELSQLKRYLHETLGAEVTSIPWVDGKRLPFFLRNLYIFFEIQLLEASCLLMVDRNEQEQSPAILRKHMDQVQAKWDGEVLYVRSRVTAYNRKRLIENKLPFVVPGNQMYLPMFGIDLREHFRKLRIKTRKFSPSTQALIIYMLLHGTPERIYTPAEMAGCLGYSAMTMTRAFDELESAELGAIFLKGRERCVRFAESSKDIWTKAQPFMRSPVKKHHFIKGLNSGLPGPRAGLTALADYSMLAEPVNPIIALSGKDWKSLKQRHGVIEFLFLEPGVIEIEVWGYMPKLFARSNVVDRLSLYLSLKESQDERVEAALEEMMKGVQW